MLNIYTKAIPAAICLFLAGCGDNSERYLLPDFSVEQRLGTAARTVEVGKLELPAYVQDTEINLQDAEGVLRPLSNGFWAEDPDRAMTELLAVGLDQSLSADVAAEPLPFSELADVRLDVKVRRFVGVPGESLQFSGQYFLTAPQGGSLQRIKRFDISVPIASESVQDYAVAQSQALKTLTADIARSLSGVRKSQILAATP